ncbi:hypothetical protein [Labedella endophytica]|uniref:Uncharacterized protein n=1 Tax=Labedella endophytica TaxID=1523160 RepID=A0A3S0X4V4_9MICO|nr:hypothetical protein [Labedella endophytica]RUQ98269.1 hypothetical protein ELQ94_14790 [Labedella endophytica]
MPKKPPAVIRFVLEADASGALIQSEHTMPLDRVWLNGVQRFSNLAVFYTREYSPSETDRLDVYHFAGHSSGSGWIVLEGFTPSELAETRDQMRLHSITGRLGRVDPGVGGSSGFMAYFPWTPRTPVADLVVAIIGLVFLVCGSGLALVTAGLATAGYGFELGVDDLWPSLLIIVLGVGLGGFGLWRYRRRRSWWADARGLAIRDYGTIPAYLRR